jgi:hypothetical protein
VAPLVGDRLPGAPAASCHVTASLLDTVALSATGLPPDRVWLAVDDSVIDGGVGAGGVVVAVPPPPQAASASVNAPAIRDKRIRMM